MSLAVSLLKSRISVDNSKLKRAFSKDNSLEV